MHKTGSYSFLTKSRSNKLSLLFVISQLSKTNPRKGSMGTSGSASVEITEIHKLSDRSTVPHTQINTQFHILIIDK